MNIVKFCCVICITETHDVVVGSRGNCGVKGMGDRRIEQKIGEKISMGEKNHAHMCI